MATTSGAPSRKRLKREGASPWDNVAPSPTPIRASGSRSQYGGKSSRGSLSEEGYDNTRGSENSNQEISESMRQQMDYNSDRAWYDREEGSSTFDMDRSTLFLGDEASFQKKEAELAKRLTRKDGSKMSLAQSKKLSQLCADNVKWEDRQLLRSGAVKGTEVQTEFDHEDEKKIILRVHDKNPLFWMEVLCSQSKLNQ